MRTTLLLALLLVTPAVIVATAPTAAALYCDRPEPGTSGNTVCSHGGTVIVALCRDGDVGVGENCKTTN